VPLALVPNPQVIPKEPRALNFGNEILSREAELDVLEGYGSQITTKPANTLRIGFQNIGSFSTKNNSLKDDIIRSGLKHWEFDIFGMVETNIDWRLAAEHEKLHFRTREWWESSHISYSYNCSDVPIMKHQHGGSALFSMDKSAHRVSGKGVDPSMLGRWCWTKYKGRNNHSLYIITAYRPNPPGGPYTVYAQQQQHFHLNNDNRCPRLALLEDICKDINVFLEEGAQVILLIDSNSSMKSSDLTVAFSNICYVKCY
jgi:hypothetical protein